MISAQHPTFDSVVVKTPLPGGIGPMVRAMFNAPTWLQYTAAAVMVIIFAVAVFFIWKFRSAIYRWLTTRSRGWKIAMAGMLLVMATGGTWFGKESWDYMQHNNDFCISCHVMNPAWQRFQKSEHNKLLCHNCHQQSMYASMKQLVVWVAEKPKEIPAHAKVPTGVCEGCHNQEHPDSVWKHILTTAGHSVHMRNDTTPLKKVQCVTCHGAEVHHFVPVDKTCGQSGCHENLRIQLGKMAGQSSLHCTGCHNFTEAVADGISPDSSRKSLIPTGAKCLDCHAMQKKVGDQLVSLRPENEPHKAVCGNCHNPHKQANPKAAFETCAQAACHARADTLTPFHRGLPKNALDNCGSCHKAHIWKVASTDCVACHQNLGKAPAGIKAAEYHKKTNAAPSAVGSPASPSKLEPPKLEPPKLEPPGGPYVPDDDALAESETVAPEPPQQIVAPAKTDTTFNHAKHTGLACTNCHSAKREHGELLVTAPRGCQECHHSPKQTATCTTCHKSNTLPAGPLAFSTTLTVKAAAVTKTLPFEHTRHAKVECKNCHTTPVTLVAERSCNGCHTQHHTPDRTCATCHPPLTSVAEAAHPRNVVHEGCGGSGCHRDGAVLALPPSRNVCLSCHRKQENHQPGAECATCHLVQWPESPNVRTAP